MEKTFLKAFHEVEGYNSEEDNNRSWLAGLSYTKAPNEKADYADWSLIVRAHPGDTRGQQQGTVTKRKTNPKNDGPKAVTSASIASTTETSNANNVVVYSVHRVVLASQSDFFKALFKKRVAGSTQNKRRSVIRLPSPLVTLSHFERVLDFLYMKIRHGMFDDAVATLYLARYLKTESLQIRAKAFIGQTMSLLSRTDYAENGSKELANYYCRAQRLSMHDIQDSIVRCCAQHPEALAKNTALSNFRDTNFWCCVWDARKSCRQQSRPVVRLWSENAAHFVAKHFDAVDLDVFRKLTDINSLPVISPGAAIILMEQEQDLLPVVIDKNELTCLQTRCVKSLYDTTIGVWRLANTDPINRQELCKRLEKLPSIVLKSIVSRSMEVAPPRIHLSNTDTMRREEQSNRPENLRSGILKSTVSRTMEVSRQQAQQGFYIEVFGAGMESADGIYRLGHFGGKHWFFRRGKCKGRNVMFVVLKHGNCLKLRVCGHGIGYYRDLYEASVFVPFDENNPSSWIDKLPENGWIAYSSRIGPAPKVRYRTAMPTLELQKKSRMQSAKRIR